MCFFLPSEMVMESFLMSVTLPPTGGPVCGKTAEDFLKA